MEIYLLKSSAILFIFWLLYVFFLEKENLHSFKRFYLITSVILAFIIPLLSITEYVYVEPLKNFDLSNVNIPFVINEPIEIIETPFWTLERILWSVYILGVALFSFRFIKNLFSIVKTIKTNEKQKQSSITFVLLKKLINPHTFFNFIFLNKLKFQKNEVPKEVLLHEEVHAKQKHSLDILFIELMQIVFWFLPFIWLFKKRIKLNHEFLADQAVIDAGFKPSTYQNTLLNYSSQQDYSLANAIDYSSIKKRFTVMKTQTSQKKKWALRLLVLPLLGLLFYSFSEREIVEVEQELEINQKLDYTINVDENNKFYFEEQQFELNKIEKFIPITDNLQIKLELAKGFDSTKLQDLMSEVMTEFTNRGVRKLSVCSAQNFEEETQQNQPTAKEIAEYNAWVKKINSKTKTYVNNEKILPPVDEKNLIKYASIHNRMSAKQKQNAEKMPFPGFEYVRGTENSITTPISILVNGKNCEPCELTKKEIINAKLTTNTGKKIKSFAVKFMGFPTQGNVGNTLNKKTKAIVEQYNATSPAQFLNIKVEGQKKSFNKLIILVDKQQNLPTAKEIAAYNAWAKKINTKNKAAKSNKEYAIVKHKEVVKYKAIYDRMTKAQKNNSETWPNFPPPPPPPPAPKSPKVKKTDFDVPPPPPPPMPKEAKGKLTIGHINAYNEWMTYIKSDKTNAKYMTVEIYKSYRDLYEAMTDEQKKLTDGMPPPPPPPPAPKKVNKSKGGPNADIENNVSRDFDDLKARQLILRASKTQNKPLIYKINSKQSTLSEVESFIIANNDANLQFTEGETNILEFSKKNKEKMSAEAIQNVYSKVFKTYDKSDNGRIEYYRVSQPNEVKTFKSSTVNNCLEVPSSFTTKIGKTLNIKCVDNYTENKFQVFNKYGNLIYTKENYSNNWDGTVENSFAADGSDKPISGTYYYVFSSPKLDKQKVGYLAINIKNSDIPRIKKSKEKGGPNADGYQVDKNTASSARKIYLSISKKGEYALVSKNFTNVTSKPITLDEIDMLLSKMSQTELENTFVFSSYSDLKKYRNKPSSTPEYQDDIEIWLIKAENKNGGIARSLPVKDDKNLFLFQLVYDNGIDNLKPHLDKLINVFKKYKDINKTL